ncbi:unnamed protein product [Phytophthora fragariaefolia]|uniref:Unnamed protein product n=1 Tax=Phytophthora fragariaefolia TaxID=1490495 RepID=A0A9W7CUT6_9STRA|nr:unnamed protein product [Phytophthora fragariaefolia]
MERPGPAAKTTTRQPTGFDLADFMTSIQPGLATEARLPGQGRDEPSQTAKPPRAEEVVQRLRQELECLRGQVAGVRQSLAVLTKPNDQVELPAASVQQLTSGSFPEHAKKAKGEYHPPQAHPRNPPEMAIQLRTLPEMTIQPRTTSALVMAIQPRTASAPEMVIQPRADETDSEPEDMQTETDYRPNKHLVPAVIAQVCKDYQHLEKLQAIAAEGVRVELKKDVPLQAHPPDNHGLAIERVNILRKNVRKEQDAWRCLVLDLDLLAMWPEVFVSPFGIVDKAGGDPLTSGRTIHDLSFPVGASINDVIDQDQRLTIVTVMRSPPRYYKLSVDTLTSRSRLWQAM